MDEYVEILAEVYHNEWMNSKLADGWMYDEVYSSENKTSPILMPYDMLPEPSRENVRGVVRRVISAMSVVGPPPQDGESPPTDVFFKEEDYESSPPPRPTERVAPSDLLAKAGIVRKTSIPVRRPHVDRDDPQASPQNQRQAEAYQKLESAAGDEADRKTRPSGFIVHDTEGVAAAKKFLLPPDMGGPTDDDVRDLARRVAKKKRVRGVDEFVAAVSSNPPVESEGTVRKDVPAAGDSGVKKEKPAWLKKKKKKAKKKAKKKTTGGE